MFSNDFSYEDTSVECVAFNEADLETCPCSSCGAYRRKRARQQYYNEKYEDLMGRLRVFAADPFYQSETYLKSGRGS